MSKRLAISCLVIAIAAFLFGWSMGSRPADTRTADAAKPGIEQPASPTVSLMFDFGEGTVKIYDGVKFTDGQTLFDITKGLAEQHGLAFQFDPPGQYGILVTQIGDKHGGPPDNKYWTWYENNSMGQVSADSYKLKPGDVLEWKFVNLKETE